MDVSFLVISVSILRKRNNKCRIEQIIKGNTVTNKYTVDFRSIDDVASLLLLMHNQKTLQHMAPITSGMSTLNQLSSARTQPASRNIEILVSYWVTMLHMKSSAELHTRT